MKTTRTLLLITIVLLTILLFKTCNKEESCNHSVLNENEVIANYKNSRHTINIGQVADLFDNYKDRFIPIIKQMQDNIDTNNGILQRDHYLPTEYSLMPLQKLKDYINFIEVLQQKNPEQIISGIAISFGAYNLTDSLNIEKESTGKRKESILNDPLKIGDYRGRLTTFMTPTYYSEKNTGYDADNHIPFYIIPNDNSDVFKGEYRSLYKYLDSIKGYASNNNKIEKEISKASFLPTFNAANAKITIQSVSSNELTDMPPRQP
ncbi:hypothetical protein [Polaribacter sp.]|uniref:hypothetical protein n=1 Tax=Polaribacter sp. TaxID=1920175 RepID=UPI003EF9597D